MSKHTRGPWMAVGNITGSRLRKEWLIIQDKHTDAANIAHLIPCVGMTDEEIEANAKRIVACVNACRGVDYESLLDDAVVKLREDRNQLLEQNKELLAALEKLLEAAENLENDDQTIPEPLWTYLQDAIAKVKGGQS